MATKVKQRKTEAEPEPQPQPNANSTIESPITFPAIPISKCIPPSESHKEVLMYNKMLNNYYNESFSTKAKMNEYVKNILSFEASRAYLPRELTDPTETDM